MLCSSLQGCPFISVASVFQNVYVCVLYLSRRPFQTFAMLCCVLSRISVRGVLWRVVIVLTRGIGPLSVVLFNNLFAGTFFVTSVELELGAIATDTTFSSMRRKQCGQGQHNT